MEKFTCFPRFTCAMMMRISHTHDVIGILVSQRPTYLFFCFLELRQFGIVCGGNFFASNLDQLFGVLSRRLSRSSSMVDADSVCQILEDEVKKPSLQKWVNAKIIVGVVRRYRNWKAHNVENCPVQLETLL